jgi:hypothetical protein
MMLIHEPKPMMETTMHPMTCTCPSCAPTRGGEFEFEHEAFENEEVSEHEELELAMELLSVQNEHEMEQFLGKLVRGIGRGLKSIGKIALPALKSLAKVALPIAGKALGSFIPIPGVGTMIGGALGRAAANALEMEFAGMDPGQVDIEKARRIVRVLRSAIRDLSFALGSNVPENDVRSALASAVQRHIPGANLSSRSIPSRAGISPAAGASTASGRWWRRGSTIVVDGA